MRVLTWHRGFLEALERAIRHGLDMRQLARSALSVNLVCHLAIQAERPYMYGLCTCGVQPVGQSCAAACFVWLAFQAAFVFRLKALVARLTNLLKRMVIYSSTCAPCSRSARRQIRQKPLHGRNSSRRAINNKIVASLQGQFFYLFLSRAMINAEKMKRLDRIRWSSRRRVGA